jgi:hypothetical protein
MMSTFNVLLSIFTAFLCTSGILADTAPEQTVWLIRDTICRKKLTRYMNSTLPWTCIINVSYVYEVESITTRSFLIIKIDRLAVNNPPAADMLEMTWDDELADKAQGWADNCEFAYDPKHYTAKYDSVGQNLYSSDELVDIFQNATATWAEEKDYYIYDYPCPAGQVCNHYTQVCHKCQPFSPEFPLPKLTH